jgi:hypothetical protein
MLLLRVSFEIFFSRLSTLPFTLTLQTPLTYSQVCVQETAEEFSSKLKTLLEEDVEAFADSMAAAGAEGDDDEDDDEASGSASKKKKGKEGKRSKKAGAAATKGESAATTADRE